MAVQTKFLYVNRDTDAEVELLAEFLSNGWRVVNFRSSVEEIQYGPDNATPRKQEVVEWYYHLEKVTPERGPDDVSRTSGEPAPRQST